MPVSGHPYREVCFLFTSSVRAGRFKALTAILDCYYLVFRCACAEFLRNRKCDGPYIDFTKTLGFGDPGMPHMV